MFKKIFIITIVIIKKIINIFIININFIIIFNYIIINIIIFWNTIIPNKSPYWQQKYNNLRKFANFLRLFNKICTFITILYVTYTINPNEVLLRLYY